MSNKIRVLETTKKFINKGWCRWFMAKKGRNPISAYDPEAEAWCLVGAIERACCENKSWHLKSTILFDIKKRVGMSMDVWNDNIATKQEVLFLIDQLIKSENKNATVQ